MKCKVPVHVWNVGNTKGPVKGGACCSIEDAREAANLTLENVKIGREKKAGQNMRLLEPHSIPHGLHGEHRSLGGQGHTLHRSQEQESQCSP